MDIKTTTTKFSYRIQPKPEGGFVGIPSDPAMETIEGSTKEEVEQKIQAKISDMIGAQLPTSLKLGGINVTVNHKLNFTTRTQSGPALCASRQTDTSQDIAQIGSSTPIVPSDNAGTILRVIAVLLAVGALIYFYLLRK